MKASITRDGTLTVAPETATEAYALKMWSSNYWTTGKVSPRQLPSALHIRDEVVEPSPTGAASSRPGGSKTKHVGDETLLDAVSVWTLVEHDAKQILDVVANWLDRKIGEYPTFVIAEWIRTEAKK